MARGESGWKAPGEITCLEHHHLPLTQLEWEQLPEHHTPPPKDNNSTKRVKVLGWNTGMTQRLCFAREERRGLAKESDLLNGPFRDSNPDT